MGSSTTKEKRKTKCFNRIKCVKLKMDLVKRNGNQVSIKELVYSSQKMTKNLEKKRDSMMMRVVMERIKASKKRMMMNKVTITFDSAMSDICLTYSITFCYFKFFT